HERSADLPVQAPTSLLQRRAESAPMPDHLPGPMFSPNVLSPTRRTVLAGIAAGGVSTVLKAASAVARAADLPTTIAEAGTRFRSGDLTSLDLTKATSPVSRSLSRSSTPLLRFSRRRRPRPPLSGL